MLSIPGVGEAMFSITSSPTNEEYMEFSIKKVRLRYRVAPFYGGRSADYYPRGLTGNAFPVDTAFAGHDMLFYCRRYRLGTIKIGYKLLPPLP